MKTARKVLVLALCAILLVSATVMGTLAYLTSQDTVVNTFTVGSVAITLDELDTDNDSNTSDNVQVGETTRDKANEYHLLPGKTYTKDPTIHVNASSEDCWVFVKVENGISAYEATATAGDNAYTPIAEQITGNGWTNLTGVNDVYYQSYTKNQIDKDLEVFSGFKIGDNANSVNGWSSISPATTKINVTGYAVQKDGFNTAIDAWNATFGVPSAG